MLRRVVTKQWNWKKRAEKWPCINVQPKLTWKLTNYSPMDSGGQTALKRRKHNIMQFKHVYKPKKQSTKALLYLES